MKIKHKLVATLAASSLAVSLGFGAVDDNDPRASITLSIVVPNPGAPSFNVVGNVDEAGFLPYAQGSKMHVTNDIDIEYANAQKNFVVHVFTEPDYDPENVPAYPENRGGYPEALGLFLLGTNDGIVKATQTVAYDDSSNPVNLRWPIAIPLKYVAYDYKKPDNSAQGYTLFSISDLPDLSNFDNYFRVFENGQIARNTLQQPIFLMKDQNGQVIGNRLLESGEEPFLLDTGAAYVYANVDNSSGSITFRFATDIHNAQPGTYARDVYVVMDMEDPVE
jgi:hypothetical protein